MMWQARRCGKSAPLKLVAFYHDGLLVDAAEDLALMRKLMQRPSDLGTITTLTNSRRTQPMQAELPQRARHLSGSWY